MIKLTPTAGTYTANATIPLTQVFNTNNKLALSSNAISIREAGFVEVEGNINVTSTATGVIQVNLIANGSTVATTGVVSSAIGDELTIPVYDLFRVIPQSLLSGFATISLQIADACTISGGVITAKYIR